MSQFLDSHIIESIKAQFDGHAKALQPTCGDEETHWAVPIHPDLVPWSVGEQLDALHGFATALEAWRNGKVKRGPRIVINAVAGSGKTTVLQAMLVICCRIAPEMHTVASAFNRAISKLLKAILKALKKECGFIGATVIGDSNGVQAAGRRLIVDEARRHGLEIYIPKQGGNRVQKFCRIIIQEMLVNDAATVAKSKKEITRLVNARLTGLQDAVDTKYNHSVYLRLAGGQGLKAIVTALMDYAINPSDDEEADLDLISDLLKKVGSDLGLNENHCLHALGTKPAHSLARKVLVRLKTTAWVQGPHRPQFVVDEASLSDKYGWSIGDTLVPDTRNGSSNWGDLQPVWMVADSRENKSAKFNLLSKEWLVVGEGKSNVKVEMNGAKCRIETTANGRLNVYLKSAATASTKRPAWGGIMVKQFIKNNGGRWDGAKWHGISASAEQALRDGFKMPADDGDQGDVEVTASGVLEIAMDDMTWLPLAFDLQATGDLAEMVFVDEVQDLSVAKASLLHRIADVSTSGFVLVGDLKQAIYGWAGADSRALQSNAEILGCKAYPMTYCWRNSHRVAETAVIRCQQASAEVRSRYPNADLPDYSAHRSPTHIPSWPVGALPARIHGNNIIKAVKWLQANVPNANGENQIIIGCRLNAPLAGFIKSFIKAGMPISTPADEGGIVDECLRWINRDAPSKGFRKPPNTFGYGLGFKGKKHTATSALNTIKQCQEALLITSTACNGNDGAAALLDSTYTEGIGVLDLLSTIIGLWSNESTSIQSQAFDTGFKAFAETLFAGGEGAVMLSSIHRIKGGEGTIFMPVEQALVKGTNEETGEKEMQVKDMFLSKRAMEQSEAAAVQEVNIVYVAYTRAKAATLPIYYTDSLRDQNVEAVLEWAFDEDPDSYTESDGNDDDGNDDDEPRPVDESKGDDTCHECDYLFEEGDSVHDCVSCSRPVHTAFVNERKGEYNKCSMPASLEAMLDDTIEEYICHTCLDKQGEALKEAEATDDAENSNEAVVKSRCEYELVRQDLGGGKKGMVMILENRYMGICLTLMETRILAHLKKQWYNWGSEPTFSDYFSAQLKTDIQEYTMNQMRGSLSSLQQKGLVDVQEIPDYPFAGLKDSSGKAHIIYPTARTYLFFDEHIKFIVEHFADWMTKEDKEYALKQYDYTTTCSNAGGHWFDYTRNGEKVQGDADSAKGGVAGDVISPVFDYTGTWMVDGKAVTETRPLSGTPCNGIFVASERAEQERNEGVYAPEYALNGKQKPMRPAVEHTLPIMPQEGFAVEAETHCRTCCSKVMRAKLFETPNMKEKRLAGEDA